VTCLVVLARWLTDWEEGVGVGLAAIRSLAHKVGKVAGRAGRIGRPKAEIYRVNY
jgi:hypothetical protein